jgi:hypothetical protein
MEEVILVKIESIEKCVKRIEGKLALENFDMEDYDTQDIIVIREHLNDFKEYTKFLIERFI